MQRNSLVACWLAQGISGTLIGLWSQDLFATLLTGVTLAWPSHGWAVTFLLHTISGEDPGTVSLLRREPLCAFSYGLKSRYLGSS